MTPKELDEYLEKKYPRLKLPSSLCYPHNYEISISQSNDLQYDIIKAECSKCSSIKTKVRYRDGKSFEWEL